ncbi:unnamed protein product [Zymoseptoria tritici ST99CH_1E4]|uniref:Uncharacterized protein n=1 Tax=Zymoseptoria tritici ST99CH_1E4 TaxID=1276532 RepID=A0A2H1FMI2_ZYMTR|nr:unnamed protein product [Zymoseptoria tritici ST99CH_1E4]
MTLPFRKLHFNSPEDTHVPMRQFGPSIGPSAPWTEMSVYLASTPSIGLPCLGIEDRYWKASLIIHATEQ